MKQNKVTIFTSGKCSGNPGIGGWSSILIVDNKEKDLNNQYKKSIAGYNEHTTNNEMTLTAVVEALSCLKYPCEVTMYSKSNYIIDSINQDRISVWKRSGWKTSTKNIVKNSELWLSIYNLLSIHDVIVKHTSDIIDVEFNKLMTECEDLAKEQIKLCKLLS